MYVVEYATGGTQQNGPQVDNGEEYERFSEALEAAKSFAQRWKSNVNSQREHGNPGRGTAIVERYVDVERDSAEFWVNVGTRPDDYTLVHAKVSWEQGGL